MSSHVTAYNRFVVYLLLLPRFPVLARKVLFLHSRAAGRKSQESDTGCISIYTADSCALPLGVLTAAAAVAASWVVYDTERRMRSFLE